MMKRELIVFAFVIFLMSLSFASSACTFQRLYWGPGTAVENTDVIINIQVKGDTCQGKVISLAVKEYDHGLSDDSASSPASVTVGSNSPPDGSWVYRGATWRTQWQEDTDHPAETNPPEYYIIAFMGDQNFSSRDPLNSLGNQYLNVTKYVAPPPPQCTNSTWCQSQFGANYICWNGNCTFSPPGNSSNVSNQSQESGQCTNFMEGEILVGFDENTTRLQATNLVNNSNLTYEDVYTNNNWTNPLLKVLKVFVNEGEELAWISFFGNQSIVNYSEPNCIVSIPENLRQQANQSITNAQKKLDNLTNEIRTFPDYYQQSLENAIGLISLQEKLSRIKKDYNNSNSDQNYTNVIKNTTSLNIPSKITTPIEAKNIPFFPNKNFINLEVVRGVSIGGYNESDGEKYINSIISWNQNNLDVFLNYKEIDGLYSDGEKPLISAFEISIDEKRSVDSSYYLFVRKVNDLSFGGSYGQKESSGYYYITLSDSTRRVAFTTTENVDFLTLPAFISPSLENLEITKPEPPPKDRISKWWVYLIILVFVLIFGAVIYVVLQRWYENKYEDYLFKNKNHLFNLITYINNSRVQGIKDEEISSRLRRAGWDGEQIRYGLRKYSGKNTGMPRIPILSPVKDGRIPVPSAPPKPAGRPPRVIPRKFR